MLSKAYTRVTFLLLVVKKTHSDGVVTSVEEWVTSKLLSQA